MKSANGKAMTRNSSGCGPPPRKGFDELDRGEGIEFETMDDLSAHLRKIGEEASAEIAAERKGG